MNSKEYLQFHKAFCRKMIEITKNKNKDYTGHDSVDPFKNFRMPEIFGFARNEQGFATRMCDKLARISTFVKKGILLVKDEQIEDSLIDLSNYCILFAGYIRSQKEGKYGTNKKIHKIQKRKSKKKKRVSKK